MDPVDSAASTATVGCETGNPSGALLCGWLTSKLGVETTVEDTKGPGITEAGITVNNGYRVRITRPDGRLATLSLGEDPERKLPLPRRELGDLLAEELRRMDPDYVYAEALSAATGVGGLDQRPATRTHVWRDPAWAESG
jgi:glucose-6-phosphate dehydrogenase assembly protein OpcA